MEQNNDKIDNGSASTSSVVASVTGKPKFNCFYCKRNSHVADYCENAREIRRQSAKGDTQEFGNAAPSIPQAVPRVTTLASTVVHGTNSHGTDECFSGTKLKKQWAGGHGKGLRSGEAECTPRTDPG